jgi:hypothetical protein
LESAIPIRFQIHKDPLPENSFDQLKKCPPMVFRCDFSIQYVSQNGVEIGEDTGGIHRDWVSRLGLVLFGNDSGLFRSSPVGNAVCISPTSNSTPNALSYFRFAGCLIGHAIMPQERLPVHLSRGLRRQLLGRQITPYDLAYRMDPDEFVILMKTLDMDATTLSKCRLLMVHEVEGDPPVEFALVPGGEEIEVTIENRLAYVEGVARVLLHDSIAEQIEAFRSGFAAVIPIELLSNFTSDQLDLLIAGETSIDVDDWSANLALEGYDRNSDVVVWFLEIVREGNEDFRREVLSFATGAPSVPIGGFAKLHRPFSIVRQGTVDHLPVGHTCFNRLDLAPYPSKAVLVSKLMKALEWDSGEYALH